MGGVGDIVKTLGLGDSGSSQAAKIGQTEQTIEQKLADFILNTSFDHLPADVVERAKAQIVYQLGLAFAGSFNEEGEQMRRAFEPYPYPAGVSVIGEPFRLQTSDAAFANTTLMRATWRDDVLFPAGVHPGIMSIPPALAFAEARSASGRELILAIVLAYEVLGKLASARGGWSAPMPRRPTMIFGGFGALTAAASLLKFDRRKAANAMAYGANLCSGVPEGGQVDHFYSLINRNGAFAAAIVEAGGEPYGKTVIAGNTGLYRSFFGEVPSSLSELINNLGQNWEILRAEYKRYHGTGQNTVAIELMRALRRTHNLAAKDVSKIRVIITPERSHRAENLYKGPFKNEGEAYSSMPYALALALLFDDVAADKYTRAAITDKNTNGIARMIDIGFEDGHEMQRYCRIELETVDGRSVSKASDGFVVPFSRSEWGAWLRRDGERLLPARQLAQSEEMIVQLEHLDDVRDLMAALRPA